MLYRSQLLHQSANRLGAIGDRVQTAKLPSDWAMAGLSFQRGHPNPKVVPFHS
jgi:hypothetical protein